MTAFSFDDERERGQKLATRLAKDVLTLAALGGMPDSYWLTDARILRACKVLDWTPERARKWAEK